MTDPRFEQVEKFLRAGKPDDAVRTAAQICHDLGATREVAIELAKSTAKVYRDLVTPPVKLFIELAPMQLPTEVAQILEKAMGRLFKMAAEWQDKLWAVHTERLARELREWTRGGHIEPCAANIARLIALVPEGQRSRRAQYIGNVLATVINNQREAQAILQHLGRKPAEYRLSIDLVAQMEAARSKRFSEIAQMNLENLEREFSSTLVQTCVDIQSALPDSTAMGEPDENVLRDVGDIFRSIARAPIDNEQPELLLDVTNVFVDFVPREISNTAKLARVESRTYNNLGPTAKKAVLLTFQELGKNHFFNNLYKGWAADYRLTDSIRPIVEVMGALRTGDFNDFLVSVRDDPRSASRAGAALASALGNIGGEEADEHLLSDLRKILAHRRLDTPEIRQAERIITSLANVIKSPRTSPEERKRILDFVHTNMPEDLVGLACHAAMQLYTWKPAELTPHQRQFAVRAIVRQLWVPDQTTAMHKGEERPASELGARHEPTEALKRIAPHAIDELAAAVEPNCMRFSGAYMAIAEVMEKSPSPKFLPLLERMLNNALAHNDSAQNNYQIEYYWDAATAQRLPITSKKVLGPLVYTIGTIGGDDAQAILNRYRDKIASGRVDPPPPEVAGFLDRFKAAEPAAQEVAPPPSAADIEELLKAIKKSYWLSSSDTRRMKKVAALTQLAQIPAIDAVEPVFGQLTDKDPMVVSAAISCLCEYANERAPKSIRDMVLNTAIDALESKDPLMRGNAVKLLKELGPGRKEVKDRVIMKAKTAERREVKEALSAVLKSGMGAALAEALGEGKQPAADGTPGAEKKPTSIDTLELRRQYMAARQEWIRNGKKGDPPVPPPGIT
jgi:HEAT repeat protein